MKTKSKNKKLRIALGICIPLIIIIAAALAVVMKYGPTFGFYLVPPSAERYGKDALATIGKKRDIFGKRRVEKHLRKMSQDDRKRREL